GVSAGFPSPADDYIQGRLDLNELMIQHPAATFFVRVAGDSMIGAGIHHDDILVVDRSLEPASGKVVIAVVNGDLTVKWKNHKPEPRGSACGQIPRLCHLGSGDAQKNDRMKSE
ncbi:MAG: translesion error-prone DNA polymerase V autoproteolytic subunit, partial [Desulfobacterales bacterium]|nr:translesion error-prone DNA polymerase V autoproteolytic subunit [Desulfobacterales bacterium]